MDDALTAYLRREADAEADRLADLAAGRVRHAEVAPAAPAEAADDERARHRRALVAARHELANCNPGEDAYWRGVVADCERLVERFA